MDALIQDIRYSLRMLAKRPGFTLVAVLTLSLGIGANTTIFSVINAVVLRPLPFNEPDRLVYLNEANPRQSYDEYSVSYPNFVEWTKQSRSFENLAAWTFSGMTLTGVGEPARLLAVYVTADFFSTLQVKPMIGQGFGPDADRPEAQRVALISHRFWQSRLNGLSDVTGQIINLNGDAYSIAGVMPPDFRFPGDRVEVYLPLGVLVASPEMRNRAGHLLRGVGRLRRETTLDQARSEMETIMARIEQTHPGEDPGHTILARSLHEQTVGDVKNILVILFGAVGCVLLIACVNVANLLLVRSSERQKEMAIRAALGAGRGRAVTQLLTESILLALIGGLVSMILALWGVDLLRVALADLVPRADEIRLDGAVFGFTLALSLATGLIFGLFPALQISRTDLNAALKDRMSISGERSRLRHGLVVAEVALSLVLLIGAGLMLRSFWRVLEEPPGFRTDHLLLMSISLPNTEYPETAQVVDFYRRLPGLFEDIPGIQAVSAVNALPISGGDSNGMLTVENRTFPPGEEPVTSYRRALPNYFRTIGIPLLRGREFDERDTGEGVKTVIINDLMARRYFPDQDPIGKRIKVGPPEGEPWLEIVGVIGDVRNVGLDSEPALATYEPHAQRSWRTMNMVMRTGVDPSSLIEGVRRRLREQVPNILISDVSVMDQRIADSLGSRRLSLTLLGVFSGVALILALVGVYGVMAYLVTLRTREIGVRMALGAQRIDVMRMIAGKALMLTATGIVVGLAASAAGVTLIADFLYRVSPFDPVTFAVLSFILLVTALLSSYIPARRAARVDPLMALRQE